MSHPFTKAAANQFASGDRTMEVTIGDQPYELSATLPTFNPADPNLNMVRVAEPVEKPKRVGRPRRSGTDEAAK